jgi:hypothetical protein
VLHLPLYLITKLITDKYFNNDHYDSVFNSLLMLAYPFYCLIGIGITVYYLGILAACFILLLLPFSAWAWVQVKYDAGFL